MKRKSFCNDIKSRINYQLAILVAIFSFALYFSTSQVSDLFTRFTDTASSKVSIVLTCDLKTTNADALNRAMDSISSQSYSPINFILAGLIDSTKAHLPTKTDTFITIDTNSSILDQRNIALEQLGEDRKGYVLFLDDCQQLASSYSIGFLVKTWERLNSVSSSSYGRKTYRQPIHYLHLNSNQMAMNPHKIISNTSLMARLSTSIFTRRDIWRDVFKKSVSVPGCSKRQRYWMSSCMNRAYGLGLDILLLQEPKYIPSVSSDKKCDGVEGMISSKQDRKKQQFQINDLSVLKREWNPSISVIIPFYNVPSETWFDQTLSSIAAQTFTDFEIIIVNDGSTRADYNSFVALEKFQNSLSDGKYWRVRHKATDHEIDIPVSVVHHAVNLGLAEARNTGVKTARGTYIIFLDPDDLLEKTALEKLVLFAINNVGKSIPHRGDREKYGFVYSGTVHFGRKDDVVFSEYSSEALLRENYITATTLVSRIAYLEVGGMCPRTTIRYFEDFDFWLRMLSMGYQGKMLREPLFWYRRHDEGQSAKIMQDAASNGDTSGFLKEVRRNNPVAYGDMRLKDALKLLEDPNYAREAAERLPCYRKMKQYNDLEVEIGRILSDIETEYYSKHETRGRNQVAEIKLTHASQSIKPEEAILSPLNPLHHRFYTQSDAKMSIVILIPWMVMGGADLYDVSILQGLRNKERYHITIIVERNILTQSWLSRYQKIADEIFHLQIMTNSSSRQDEIIDYIVESRQTSLFINSRTIAGYRAFERWNEEKGGYFSTIKLVDILHLYHFNDRTNWEWRSGQAGKYTDARVVVSQDLARFMIDVVRYGDEELGNPSDPEDAYLWESLKQEPDGTYSSNTTRPILEKSEIDKFKVIYPPIDLPSSISSFPNHTRYWWSDAVDLSPRDVERRPTVFFLGRFDSQKDPLFWLDVVKEYYDLFKSLHQSSDPRFVMLGSGSLLYSIKQRLKSAEYSKIRPFLEIYPVEHTQVAIELAKQTNAIMLMTSRFEGVPITLLEAAALGIPSISLDCGGFKEVLQHESFWDTPLAKHAGKNVHRGQLASIIGYKCEGPIEHVPIARPKELAVFMARELRYWFDEMDSGSDVDQEIAARRKRWDSAARFRKEYGVGSFQAKWEALIYNLVSLH